MTKEALAKLDPSMIRKDNALFSLFKKYVTEDAGLIYPSGKLPSGCFGCQFNSLFRKWSLLYKEDLQLKNAIEMKTQTYKLKEQSTAFYFGGKILNRKSSDAEWLQWINYPTDPAKVKQRQEIFEVIPGLSESKPKTTRSSKKATKKTEAKVSAEPETETETPSETDSTEGE